MKKDVFDLEKEQRKHAIAEKLIQRKYREALTRNLALTRELDAMMEVDSARHSFIIRPSHGTNTSEATIFAVASDWHIEEEVRPSWVNGMNKYNLDISKQRATLFFQRLERLIRKEQQDVKIDTLVLALLGDFVSGNIHEELLENCLLPPVEAIQLCQEYLQSGIEFLLNHTKLNILIPCHVGNHSRITKTVHFSHETGNSLEYMMYHSLAKRFSGDKRIKFHIAEGYFSFLKVYKYKIRFHHGHSIKSQGGVGGIYPPLLRAIYQWNLAEPVYQDVMGHHHSYTPSQRFTVNGSMVGYNPYALRLRAEYQDPMQALFLIDKKRGKTFQMPILFN